MPRASTRLPVGGSVHVMASERGTTSVLERDQSRAYFRDFVPGMVGYVAAIVAAVSFGDTGGGAGWRLLWWVVPLVPVGLVVRAVVRALGRSDEYQRQVQLEGLSAGFAASMCTALTLGLLGTQVDLPSEAGTWGVVFVGMVTWAVVVAIRSAR